MTLYVQQPFALEASLPNIYWLVWAILILIMAHGDHCLKSIAQYKYTNRSLFVDCGNILAFLRLNTKDKIIEVACPNNPQSVLSNIDGMYLLINIYSTLSKASWDNYLSWISILRTVQPADIEQKVFSNAFLNEWKWFISTKNPLTFVLQIPIDHIAAVVQVKTWPHISDTPWPEPMMTQFTDACTRHLMSHSI